MASKSADLAVTPEVCNSSGVELRRSSIANASSGNSEGIVVPHYRRASLGSCHDFCKYGHKHALEAKERHSMAKIVPRNPLPQSPEEEYVGGTKTSMAKRRAASVDFKLMKIRESIDRKPTKKAMEVKLGESVKSEPQISNTADGKKETAAKLHSRQKQVKNGVPVNRVKPFIHPKPRTSDLPDTVRQGNSSVPLKVDASSTPIVGPVETSSESAAHPVETSSESTAYMVETSSESIAKVVEISSESTVKVAETSLEETSMPMKTSSESMSKLAKTSSKLIAKTVKTSSKSTANLVKASSKSNAKLVETSSKSTAKSVGTSSKSIAKKVEASSDSISKKVEASSKSMAKKLEASSNLIVKKVGTSPKSTVKVETLPKSMAKKVEASPKSTIKIVEASPKSNIKMVGTSSKSTVKKEEVSSKPTVMKEEVLPKSTVKKVGASSRSNSKVGASLKPTLLKPKQMKLSEKHVISSKSNSVLRKPISSMNPSEYSSGQRNSNLKMEKRAASSKVAARKLMTPLRASPLPLKPTLIRVASINARKHKSLKINVPHLKHQLKTRREEHKKPVDNNEVEEKTLYVIKMESGNKTLQSDQNESQDVELSPPQSLSPPKFSSSSQEDQEESEYTSSEVGDEDSESECMEDDGEASEEKEKGTPKKKRELQMSKLNFKRGKLVEIQSETTSPRKLKFRRSTSAALGENANVKGENQRTKFKRRYESGGHKNGGGEKVLLRQRSVQRKKEALGLFNNVIEETANKLAEVQKSKVKALVGAFETVISLQERKPHVSSVI